MPAIVRISTYVVCMATLLTAVASLASFWGNPSAYHFGTEAASFAYESPTHFVGTNVFVVLAATAGIGSARSRSLWALRFIAVPIAAAAVWATLCL